MTRSRRPRQAIDPISGFDVDAFEQAFYDFCDYVTIVSKDTGRGRIKFFNVQNVLLKGGYRQDGIFTSLRKGRHWVVTLKARQLGATTLSLLLDVFWAAMFPGLQGGIVTDTAPNRDKIRILLEDILMHLPDSHKLPVISHNRDGIVFDTPGGRSMIDYLVAGTRVNGGNLGRSRALNFAHMTELGTYGDADGFESLKATFSEEYPFRFYHEESTPHGMGNLFYDEWEDAGEDTITKSQLFLGWWMHEKYRHRRDTSLFMRYGYEELSPDEQEISDIVYAKYGYRITVEQWSWYRHRADPRAQEHTETARDDREQVIQQEYPSYPEAAFLETGSPFVTGKMITPLIARALATKFYGFRYTFGETVLTTIRSPVDFARQSQLKVWQPPVEGGVYIVAADPAFASSDESDSYCIQVLRCYADRTEQVAEFCVRNMNTYEYTWVLIDLCAWYNECRYILEINASGEAVATEFRHLRSMLESGKLQPPDGETTEETKSMRLAARSMLSRVRQYLYRRPDSMTGTFNIHWKTNAQNKHAIMVQMRDRIALDEMTINSVECLHEIRQLRQEGFHIGAPSSKKHDDRAVALALGNRCWIDYERAQLTAIGLTYAIAQQSADEPAFNTNTFLMSMLQTHMNRQRKGRERVARQEKRQKWGW